MLKNEWMIRYEAVHGNLGSINVQHPTIDTQTIFSPSAILFSIHLRTPWWLPVWWGIMENSRTDRCPKWPISPKVRRPEKDFISVRIDDGKLTAT